MTSSAAVPEETIEYFYTTRTPHVWSSAPLMITLHPDTWEPIKSLDEARELALRFRIPGYEEDSVETSYGEQRKFKHSR